MVHASPSQIQRLKDDSRRLEFHVHRLTKQGNENLAYKVAKKQAYLNQHILEAESLT